MLIIIFFLKVKSPNLFCALVTIVPVTAHSMDDILALQFTTGRGNNVSNWNISVRFAGVFKTTPTNF